MIRKCSPADAGRIFAIINDAARLAYQSVIPADCYHEPYMPLSHLKREMKRMTFFGWEEDGTLVAVTGLEAVRDVALVRHAYVLPGWQHKGIGGKLLRHVMAGVAAQRLLVGTWAAARWAIAFYQHHGFKLLPDKDELLRAYWDIPPRQVETSVVLGLTMDHVEHR